jgi:2-hydroxy-6-oxonona-2,4-dienedioate hydrolase
VLLVPAWFPAPERTPRPSGPLETLVFTQVLRSDFLFWALGRLWPAIATRTVLATPPEVVAAASAAEQARVAAILRDLSPISQRQRGLALEQRLTVSKLSQPLEAIKVPTLAISAADDLYGTYANAQLIARRAANGRFIGFHSGGHLWVGHNEEVLAAIAAFLHEQGADP